MDPSIAFCPNLACPDKGQPGRGNIGVHSQKERRYWCTTCRKTFAATQGTALYRLHHSVDLLVLVVTLLCHGCPPQAIVAAFGLDERTVAAWLHRTGTHAARVHAAVVETGQVDLGQVQADEICVKVCTGRVWQAMALAVPSRLWLGGDLSPTRDGALVTATLRRVAACASRVALLICVDGFAAYVGAVRTVFRVAVRTGQPGRPRLVLPETVLLAQVVKSHKGRRLVDVTRRVVFGTVEAVAAAIARTKGGTQINTSYIERRERDLPRGAGTANPARAAPGPRRGPADQRHVARRHSLQLLLAPREPPGAHDRERAEVAAAHPGHGRWPHRPHLDAGGRATLPRPPHGGRASAAPDGRPRAGAGSKSGAGAGQATRHGGRRMTTVEWGGTRHISCAKISTLAAPSCTGILLTPSHPSF